MSENGNGNLFARTYLEEAFATPESELQLGLDDLNPDGVPISSLTITEKRLLAPLVAVKKAVHEMESNICVECKSVEGKEEERKGTPGGCPEMARVRNMLEPAETTGYFMLRLMESRLFPNQKAPELTLGADGQIYAAEPLATPAEMPLINGNPFIGTFMAAAFDTPAEELFRPAKPMQEGETVVGEMTELERRFLHATELLTKEKKILEDDDGIPDREKQVQFNRVNRMRKDTANVMWLLIKSRLVSDGIDPDGLGLREGGKIVQVPSSPEGSITELLGKLLDAFKTL